MQLIDTHCHLHSPEFFSAEAAAEALKQAVAQGVDKLVCVATSLEDSKQAIAFARAHPENCVATVGIHPHEAGKLSKDDITRQLEELAVLAADPTVVAVGECGFDFYYNDRKTSLHPQEQLLRGQLQIAVDNGLPLSFHVREAFNDFWRVFENYTGVQGVLHSFTDTQPHLERGLKHGLKIGINGIATFTTHTWQRDLFKALDINDFVLETDAPFLTPQPKRGKINTPENVIYITKFLADLRGESEELIAKSTTATAKNLFKLT